jgi:hypothetical protein
MVKLTQILPDFPFFHQSVFENQLLKFNVQSRLRIDGGLFAIGTRCCAYFPLTTYCNAGI